MSTGTGGPSDLSLLSEEKVEELRKRGEVYGLSAAEVKVADDAGMALPRYVGMRGVRSLDQFERVRDSEAERVKAEAEVRAERLREKARQAVS